MRTHAPVKNVKTPKLAITPVDYFAAKLAYEMTPWALKRLVVDEKSEQHLVLDVRSPEQFDLGHIPGALNVPLADLVSTLKTLPKDKVIVTYCGSITCGLAPKAALELAQKGFRVMELLGGIAEWQHAGFPIQK
jgi:ArsR family transcriptional regulator